MNIIILYILIVISLVLDSFEFEYSFVFKYVIIWYAICMLVNYVI